MDEPHQSSLPTDVSPQKVRGVISLWLSLNILSIAAGTFNELTLFPDFWNRTLPGLGLILTGLWHLLYARTLLARAEDAQGRRLVYLCSAVQLLGAGLMLRRLYF